jgi:hypothetical protein
MPLKASAKPSHSHGYFALRSMLPVQEVRHWLQLVGRGEEGDWINLSTVKGYKRVVWCQSVRDDCESHLGPGCWAPFLERMCRDRLVATTWLNKVPPLLFKIRHRAAAAALLSE